MDARVFPAMVGFDFRFAASVFSRESILSKSRTFSARATNGVEIDWMLIGKLKQALHRRFIGDSGGFRQSHEITLKRHHLQFRTRAEIAVPGSPPEA